MSVSSRSSSPTPMLRLLDWKEIVPKNSCWPGPWPRLLPLIRSPRRPTCITNSTTHRATSDRVTRVGVSLLVKGEAESLTVPDAAILYDIHGGAWVYTQLEGDRFQRARVIVDHVQGETAVLAGGPEVGTQVVVDGAAELFGTEFGTGK